MIQYQLKKPLEKSTFAIIIFFMLLLLFCWFLLSGNLRLLRELVRLYCRHWLFWTAAGTIGFGFFYARQLARDPYELSAVDATQASEVIFALAGEIFFLHAGVPNMYGIIGIIITIFGLCLYIRAPGPVRLREKESIWLNSIGRWQLS